MEHGLVRILAKDGKTPVGIGFLADSQHIITCAHVVTAALGLPNGAPQPSQPVMADFPLVDAHLRKQRLMGQVVAWRAYRDQPGYSGDIACLQLDGGSPAGTQAIPIKVKASLWKQTFRAFGVPSGFSQGVWTEGEILGRQSNGYFQVETTRSAGYIIQPGFSGGPVWSEQMQAVVAMLALAETSPNIRAAFAIPARILIEVMHEVAPGMQQTASAVTTLGVLLTLSPSVLSQLAQQNLAAAHHQNADGEDLLSAALLQLWMKRYDVAKPFLERLVQRDPGHSYACYALALCQLEGKSPKMLQNFNRAREISEGLSRGLVGDQPAHMLLLQHYIRQDYFQRNGFTAFAGNLAASANVIRSAVVDKGELDALAQVLPDIASSPLWRELRAR